MPLFDSLKRKLSSNKKDISRSPSANATLASQSSQTSCNPTHTNSGVNDPAPPPYTPTAGPSTGSSIPTIAINPPNNLSPARSNPSITSPEDPYAFLASFDTIFLIDDSSSMIGASWRETEAALRAIAPICTAHDADGIDVWFLNHRNRYESSSGGAYSHLRDGAAVERLFTTVCPAGATPTGARLRAILKPYLERYEKAVKRTGDTDDCGVKPMNIIVITDGVPTDDPESTIKIAADKLDKLEAPPHQVGIQFFQVGNERGAAEALTQLDDGLAELGVRDMVDTVSWSGGGGGLGRPELTADAILKVVLGAVVKRLDRKTVERTGRHLRP